ncbi:MULTISPECIES: glucose-1-phosphate cytidylyltransferase [unclassified Meiothermus]|uniref:glucose-1-phosphate cytidylyltransferase n=1 Tax=unclassified Meiothermus TaxID=370471 RepID=UPI000D7C9896|nr:MULTISPECIES: glucose-1-phosphate cytidylyltransferase [unclassified Meiothermus]PZA06424.1 glucose-1-phosphate cytidylyltransferase [Meiothermus sp. Pnk-1]RYM36957.1 glucose-1-phosphate cytidylyltransferase [Meiothermus sp. PNK-Is4]
MKVVILAGGAGSRLSEETLLKPKPMVEIGNMPILWHIMRHYAHYGFTDFVIALGYKGEYIKKWFSDYAALSGNLTFHLGKGIMEVESPEALDWKVELIDTGLKTQTAGRIKRLRPYLGEETFFMTFGDGVSTINLWQQLEFHRRQGRLATVTAVHPPARFGQLILEGDQVLEFTEKPLDQSWINGGFFVMEPGVFDYVEGDHTDLKETLERLATDRQLAAYRHEGFWQPMDTLRDKSYLESLWESGKAPWKVWDESARELERHVFGRV